jgi:hypothetical protein
VIVKTQNIKAGMVIYFPHLKQIFTVKSVTKFRRSDRTTSYCYFNTDGLWMWADPDFSIPVVGFANRTK